jgi:3-deoxy-manno-octulosonate cytidylyltransferase (CMP-KDO synthetase)|tara:strand:+ start:9853 stop:10551 length:699 start_codon:yes stop_codon:yes gene_type:complete
MGFKVVIPSRFHSTRLPGKPLMMIGDFPMVIHVAKKAVLSGAEEVIIATDDKRIKDVSESFGFNAIMTSKDHLTGTDRVCEVAIKNNWSDSEIIINVQGDEPLIDPKLILLIASSMKKENLSYVTACCDFDDEKDLISPNNVKVVLDANNFAVNFSREVISELHHIGIYGYSVELLKQFCKLSCSKNEKSRSLEQLRALDNNISLKVLKFQGTFVKGIDTLEDLKAIRKIFS